MHLRLLILIGLFGLTACANEPSDETPAEPTASQEPQQPAVEERAQLIPLAGTLARTAVEVSGLAWYGDLLVLLPQHPRRFSACGGTGCLFALSKARILEALADPEVQPLPPQPITFSADGVERRIRGFEGYEALAFRGDSVYLTIEAREYGVMHGYLVAGSVAPDLSAIRLDSTTLMPLPEQINLPNMSYEALFATPDRLVVIHEANGTNANPDPFACVIEQARRCRRVSFPTIEYRITDATEPDSTGHFWAINFFYPGDERTLQPALDSLALRFGRGPTHSRFRTVERLVPLRFTPEHIERVDAAPIPFELIDDEHARNWEGVVRLDERGFLLVTDSYPRTMLAFVPGPASP